MAMSPRLLRPRASGFNPKTIANLAAWYDASVATSITIQTGVQQWSDLSGNGRHLVQNITNNQPAYTTGAINGKPVVDFDGTNDSLRTAGFTLNQPFTYFMVFKVDSSTISGTPRLLDAGGSGVRSGEFFLNFANDMRFFSGASLVPPAMTAGSYLTYALYEATFNGTQSRFRATAGNVDSTGNAGTNNGSRLTLAADSNATPGSPANISVAEVLIYNSVPTSSEASKVRAYLGNKYNVTYL